MTKKETVKNSDAKKRAPAKKKTTPKKKAVVKKEEPVVVEEKEVKVEQATVEKLEVMNDDPSVVIEAPVEEEKLETPVYKEEYVIKDEDANMPLNTDDVDDNTQKEPKKPVQRKENKPKKNLISRVFGCLWNGQEMDY